MATASIKVSPSIVLELTEEEAKYLRDALFSRTGPMAAALFDELEKGIRNIKRPDFPCS